MAAPQLPGTRQRTYLVGPERFKVYGDVQADTTGLFSQLRSNASSQRTVNLSPDPTAVRVQARMARQVHEQNIGQTLFPQSSEDISDIHSGSPSLNCSSKPIVTHGPDRATPGTCTTAKPVTGAKRLLGKFVTAAKRAPVSHEVQSAVAASALDLKSTVCADTIPSTPDTTAEEPVSRCKTRKGVEGKASLSQQLVQQYRQNFRKRLKDYEEAQVKERQLLVYKQWDDEKVEYEGRFIKIRAQYEEASQRAQAAEQAQEALQLTVRTLKEQNLELRVKIHNCEDQLACYNQNEEIFEALVEKFHFTSWADAVTTIDKIRRHATTLEREIQLHEHQKRELEEQLATLTATHDEDVRRLTARCAELDLQKGKVLQEVQDLQRDVAQAAQKQRQVLALERTHQELCQAVREWYRNWSESARLWSIRHAGDPISVTSSHQNPLEMVRTLNELSNTLQPSKAGGLYHELSQLSQRVWADMTPTDLSTRDDPVKIFTNLWTLAAQKSKELRGANQQLAEYRMRSKHVLQAVESGWAPAAAAPKDAASAYQTPGRREDTADGDGPAAPPPGSGLVTKVLQKQRVARLAAENPAAWATISKMALHRPGPDPPAPGPPDPPLEGLEAMAAADAASSGDQGQGQGPEGQ
mmetsp:Transcript_6283/g.11160  ORF Transcript_6283/g.11160 Transcript_6283/m.11160 type:complete len:639 (-) Transcript_6283:1675-3591(-)